MKNRKINRSSGRDPASRRTREEPLESFVMGRNTVREVLRFAPERILDLFTDNVERVPADIQALLAKGSWKIGVISGDRLTDLCHSDSHQGIAARVKPRVPLTLKECIADLPTDEPVLILILDRIMDPHNFGAILRAAECFGVQAVVWSKNRGTSVTPVVTKSSVGASELLQLVPVSNLAQAVDTLREADFTIIAADGGAGAATLSSYQFPQRAVLVLGSEGPGVQPLLLKKANVALRIPMVGHIDSLNVSQAAAVLLARWRDGAA